MSETIENAILKMAAEYQLPEPTLRAVLETFVAAVHEAEFKKEELDSLHQVYLSLGAEAAWHYFGWAMEILDKENESVACLRFLWTETAMRLDGRMNRFRHVLERWKEERDYEDEQRELDREYEQRKNT